MLWGGGVKDLSATVSRIGLKSASARSFQPGQQHTDEYLRQNRPSPASVLTWVRSRSNCWQDPLSPHPPCSALCLNLLRFEATRETRIRTASCSTEHCTRQGLQAQPTQHRQHTLGDAPFPLLNEVHRRQVPAQVALVSGKLSL